MKLPSNRTIQKFGRDALYAGLAAALTFVANNVADLGLDPESTAVVSMLVGLALHRYIRDDIKAAPE